MSVTIKQLPEDQRPYEKCIRYGESSLTDGELLAVILRSGTKDTSALDLAAQILSAAEASSFPGLLSLLHFSVPELRSIPGIGLVKAVQLKCIGELSRRISSISARSGILFQDPGTIAGYYMERLRHEEQEHLYVMMADNRNRLLGETLISRGTANAALITPREVFVEALRMRAMGIVLIHNHPSGDPTPSPCDFEVTERIKRCGEILGIPLLDHIIIGDQAYFSFYGQGLIDHDAV